MTVTVCLMLVSLIGDVGMMSQCMIVGIPCRHTGNIARLLNGYRSIRKLGVNLLVRLAPLT